MGGLLASFLTFFKTEKICLKILKGLFPENTKYVFNILFLVPVQNRFLFLNIKNTKNLFGEEGVFLFLCFSCSQKPLF